MKYITEINNFDWAVENQFTLYGKLLMNILKF